MMATATAAPRQIRAGCGDPEVLGRTVAGGVHALTAPPSSATLNPSATMSVTGSPPIRPTVTAPAAPSAPVGAVMNANPRHIAR